MNGRETIWESSKDVDVTRPNSQPRFSDRQDIQVRFTDKMVKIVRLKAHGMGDDDDVNDTYYFGSIEGCF